MNIAAQPQGAQLPLNGFELPDFPIQAQGLMALTLVSVRGQQNDQGLTPTTEAPQDIARLPVRIPQSVPRGIQSITIESFQSGFATGFLSGLADHLQDLKSVVLYRCRLGVGGNDEAKLFAAAGLRALHFLDVEFGHDDGALIKKIAEGFTGRLERGLMFLEVGYTQDSSRDIASDQSLAQALPSLICPSLITVKFNVQLPDKVDQSMQKGQEQAASAPPPTSIRAFPTSAATKLVSALTAETTRPRPLKALNLTLYTLTLSSLHVILAQHPRLLILNVTLETPDPQHADGAAKMSAWKVALNATVSQCEELEQLEIVASPTGSPAATSNGHTPLNRNDTARALGVLPTEEQLRLLSAKCGKLNEVKGSVLRSVENGHVLWERRGGQWIGGMRDK